MDLDKEMNLLGDLVNDYNMTDELGKTLEYIKTITLGTPRCLIVSQDL